MERDAEFYDLFMDAAGAIYAGMAAAQSRAEQPIEMPQIMHVRAGLAESVGWFLVQASEFDPTPLTVDLLRVRDIYASERIVQALLELMATELWFDRDAQGAYHLTELGRAQMQRRRAFRQSLMADLAPLPVAEIERLAALLRRLIDASLASPTPPGCWCLAHSRQRAPADDAPVIVQIMQYFDDINAFRDDAHMAAWQRYGLPGYAWEAFALVCAGAAQSAGMIHAQLAHRGYSRLEYNAALAQLVQRGWLSHNPGGEYTTTEAGRAARAKAERLTDTYFFGPWVCLGTAEVAELHTLLVRLRDSAALAS